MLQPFIFLALVEAHNCCAGVVFVLVVQSKYGGRGVVHLECVTNWFVVSCASYAFKVVPPIASSKSLESAKRNPERVFESRHLFSFFSRTNFVI